MSFTINSINKAEVAPQSVANANPSEGKLTPVARGALQHLKSKGEMTAREFTSTLTVADARLPTGDLFWCRNIIRQACRFFPEEPYKHICIHFKSWSEEIGFFEYTEKPSIADGPTEMKFANNDEFESTVNRLFPGFLVKRGSSYSVNFLESEMKRACERHNFPYRPKDLPEYCWDKEITYYVKDPDNHGYVPEEDRHDTYPIKE